MKKILIFATAYFPFIGGAEVALRQATDRINDFEFDMVTAKMRKGLRKQEKIGNINVYRVGFGNKLDKIFLPIIGLIKAIKLNEKNNYALVYSLLASYAGLGAYLFKALHLRIPLLVNLQEGKDLSGGFKNIIRKLIIKKADAISAISGYLKQYAESNTKAPVELIPNGVDFKQFKKVDENKSLRNDLNIKQDDLVIITHGRLVEKNGTIDLVKAFNLLKDRHLNVKLLIVGDGFQRSEIESLISGFNLKERIIMTGEVLAQDVQKYLEISNIFIRPSLTEGLGNSFLEAMAMGLPTIGTPVGGITDFLKHEQTGLLCEPGNIKSIAEQLEILIVNQELKQRVSENGKTFVQENYNWDNIALKLKNFLIKLTS